MSFVLRNNDDQVPASSSDTGVRSVEAALRILEMLAERSGPVRVTDIAQELSLGKPRVCRHLATLEAMGLARRVGRLGYSFGDRFTRMAQHVLRERTLSEVARPALESLRDEVGYHVAWSAPTDEGAVVLNCIESERRGSRRAVNLTMGTILRYPYSPAARLAKALNGVSGSASDEPAREAMQRWKELGVDYEVDTQATGLGGIAAPVFLGPVVVGLVSLVVPSHLIRPQPSLQLTSALRRCVEKIQRGISQ